MLLEWAQSFLPAYLTLSVCNGMGCSFLCQFFQKSIKKDRSYDLSLVVKKKKKFKCNGIAN